MSKISNILLQTQYILCGYDVLCSVRSPVILAILMVLISLAAAQQYGAMLPNQSRENGSDAAQIKSQNKSTEELLEINSSTWNKWGNQFINRGHYNDSIFCYSNAIKADPMFVDPRNNKGVAMIYLARNEDAVEFFDSALRIDQKMA